MDNIFTSSDSGLENTGTVESSSSHKDITLTDISLTESTLHELNSDDLIQAIDAATSPIAESHLQKNKFASTHVDKASLSSTSTETSNGLIMPQTAKVKDTVVSKSSKEENQNKEINIFESSSLSSETGSWESVFPPKLAEKEICEKFINNERQFSHDHDQNIKEQNVAHYSEDLCPSLVQKSPFKSTSCFIDAASLADEDGAVEQELKESSLDKKDSFSSTTVFISDTPHNSLKTHTHTLGNKPFDNTNSPKSVSAWVVDMSGSVKSEDMNTQSPCTKKPADRIRTNLKNESKSVHITDNINKSRSSIDSDSSEKSSHKFYIDLSSLPDPLPHESGKDADSVSEKKNIFSMYIDLGDKSTLKEMPPRLSSSLSSKKQLATETNNLNKTFVTTKNVENELVEEQNSSVTEFEKFEALCNDSNITLSEILAIPKKSARPKMIEASPSKAEYFRGLNGDMTLIEEEPPIQQTSDLFVKLSDLDKPAIKADISLTSKRDTTSILDARMTRSIPENNWGGNHAATSKSTEIMSSFHSENALTLNRLFPHLMSEFISKSMPGSLSGRTQSPLRQGASSSHGELDEATSDISEISSVQSSVCRSVVDNSPTEDTSPTSSLIASCQSRLGQDLLRMFLEEIAPDVIVEVSGKRIKAHKCILSSRCQYFAGILSGGWVESAGNVIILPPFSHNVVHFALCHIYSGISVIPDTISIVELATIADMLGLEGLKEAIMFTLKTKYCHHFHKPCQVCIAGVLECFPLTSVYGLDDLYRKCLRWITKYFPKVWPTKAFATLPTELLEKCYQEQIISFTTDTFLDMVYGCGLTVASLQNNRWAENVARLCKRLMTAAVNYAAGHLMEIFKTISTTPAEAPWPAKHALDDCLTAAIIWAPPEEICRAYALLCGLVKEMRQSQLFRPDLISNDNQLMATGQNNLLYTHGNCWRLQCEEALVQAAPRVVGTQAFKDLPSDLRKRLRELGCIIYGAQASPIVPPIHTHMDKKKSPHHKKAPKPPNSGHARNPDIEHVRARFMPYSSTSIQQDQPRDVMKSNNDLKDFRKSPRHDPPKITVTKAHEERAKFNLTKMNQSQERINSTPRPHAFQNTKPRYLEPRTSPNIKDGDKMMQPKKRVHRMSSSESSRNSSPVQSRNVRASPAKSTEAARESKAQAMSQDNLATSSRPRTAEPSTDSLSESQASNKYATYTKFRHAKDSNESIKMGKSQPRPLTLYTGKSKIPVRVSKISKSENHGPSTFGEASATTSTALSHKECTRKASGSLMNATKASQAKMVPKVTKERKGITMKHSKYAMKHMSRQTEASVLEIPVMERSGTFLKDEATNCDKTSNVDKGQ